MRKPLIISLGLFQKSGGPLKTISKFRDALEADLYCFSDPSRVAKDPLAIEHAELINATSIPPLKQFCYAPRCERIELERAVKGASILSCHSFYRYHTIWTYKAAKSLGVPYWHVPHGILDPYVLEGNRLFKKVFLSLYGRKYLDNAACTIFSTKREKEKAESVFGTMKSEILPWPVDIPVESTSLNEQAEFRRRHNIPDEAKVILYFGRLHSMKRPLETIRAVASLKAQNVFLLMVGPEEDVSVKDCRTEAGIHSFDNIRITGPLFGRDKLVAIEASDLYVSLSHRENFNHCAAECMASGLPVLLSQGNDLGVEVHESRAGLYLNDDSQEVWKGGLEVALHKSQQELIEIGRNGQKLVKNKFSFDSFKHNLRQIESKYGRW